MIESKFVQVTNADVRNIGVNWASLSGLQVGVGNIAQTWDRSRGQIRETGVQGSNMTASNSAGTGTTSQLTDNSGSSRNESRMQDNVLYGNIFAPTVSTTALPGATVGMPATVPSITGPTGDATQPTATTTTEGLRGNTTTQESLFGARSEMANQVGSSRSNTVNNLRGLTNTGGTNRLAPAVFSASDFKLIISALQTQNDTKLVSNPTIVALNTTEAQINIGQEFPIPQFSYNTERGADEVSGFDYRPVGIILQVTPQVNSMGFIRLTIEPEVSSTTQFANFGTAQIPIATTRRTRTQVSLRDGYTMGIGGLIENRETMGQTKVPVLGSIPGLGRLFRSGAKRDQMRNLIIISITAKMVSPNGAPIEEGFSSEAVRQLRMKRSDLPGYREGSDPFLPEGVNLR